MAHTEVPNIENGATTRNYRVKSLGILICLFFLAGGVGDGGVSNLHNRLPRFEVSSARR